MELKVRADGILRVVCGVTENTTCQEVVKALAYAMGRTGRFTLIEKWRDNERPLLPSEFPLQILHKWGEYANEVQLILQQSDKQTFKSELVREPMKSRDYKHDKLVHNYNPPLPKDSGMRRSLTFSGAHNSVVPSSKRKNGLQTLHESNSADNPRQLNIPYGPNQGLNNRDPSPRNRDYHVYNNPDSSHSNKDYHAYNNHLPLPSNKDYHSYNHDLLPSNNDYRSYNNRDPSPSNREYFPQHNSSAPRSKSVQPPSVHIQPPQPSISSSSQIVHQRSSSGVELGNHKHNNAHAHHNNQPHEKHNTAKYPPAHNNQQEKAHSRIPGHNRVIPPGLASPRQPRQSAQQRLEQSKSNFISREKTPEIVPNMEVTSRNTNIKSVHPQQNSNAKSTSILPIVQNKTRSSAFQPVIPSKHKQINYDNSKQNGDIDIPVYSVNNVQTSDMVEEYDLDSNFPDIVKDSKKEILIEEYHVPGDEDAGKPYKLQEDPELMKMQRLITIQQERIKMQESQLELLETELTSLEEKDQDRTNQLQTIGEEMTQLEQKQEKYEIEITDLEKTMWVDQIETEKQKEKQFRSEISELKIRIASCESDIGKMNNKVTGLNEEINKEQNDIQENKEKMNKENEKITKEVAEVQEQLETKNKLMESEKETLDNLEEELKKQDEENKKKQEEIESLEKELKEVNMEMFNKPPSSPKNEKSDSGEAVLKMLEGRISPGIGLKSPKIGLSRKIIQSPLSQVLSSSKNPNGVWV
ncbi:hypothetical protein KUTeg_023395 [Tegillarca granosa]|uniref:Ras-associating domain-containing protein n=1 Tax=Tegillarca granosa TaxID=220873 RepID=A0ABQ9E779_TEGGR|nr:hypothetical protein KUTeg_023395 [Tegillarca granosa]